MATPVLGTLDLGQLTFIIDRSMQYVYDQYAQSTNDWGAQLCTVRKVAKYSHIRFPWVFDTGRLQEMGKNDPIQYGTVQGNDAEFSLRAWQAGIAINAWDASQDDTQQVTIKAKNIASDYKTFNRNVIQELLALGDTSAVPVYDGQNYFSNSHVKIKNFPGGLTYDNLLAGALDKDTFQAARTAMMLFPSDLGYDRPMGLIGDTLIVPAAQEYRAKELMKNATTSQSISSSIDQMPTQNVLQNMAQVIVAPQLTDPDDWYLICNNDATRPFIHLMHQEFSPFRLIAEITMNEPSFRDHREWRWWGVTGENVVPTHPWFAIKTIA